MEELKKDCQARDWSIVINNPVMKEAEFYNYLKGLNNVRYFVFVREKGEGTEINPGGTEHYHCYIEFLMPKKFSTMKKCFSKENIGVDAHIAVRKYSSTTCINYVKKEGKFANKADTRIGEIYEFGEMAHQGQRNDLIDMVDMRKNGASKSELFKLYPNSYARYSSFIEERVFDMKAEKFAKEYRKMNVTYIYGRPRTGKTRYVFDKHGYENVYRNQGYSEGKWFDGYEGQDVLLLDEYRSNFEIGQLLAYLDGHPLQIQCRYHNKQACYTKVYITSNIPLSFQHPDDNYLQNEYSHEALVSRIHTIIQFEGDGKMVYLKGKDENEIDLFNYLESLL